MRREWLICLLLAVLTLGVYWPARNYDFVYYDDPQFITENPQIRAGLTWPGVVYAFTQPVVGNWHPVTVLSHMLDCELFGPNPGAHHLVNASIHALNTALLMLLMWQLTGAAWRSALVAAIFGLHPLRVESVAWIAERKDVLSGLFFLLTIWAWSKARSRHSHSAASPGAPGTRTFQSAAASPGSASPGPRTFQSAATSSRPGVQPSSSASAPPSIWRASPPWAALALFLYALGIMSKPMLVTLPFLLILLDLWPFGRLKAFSLGAFWPLLREKLPFFLLAALASIITLLVQRGAGAMSFFRNLTLGERLANAVESYLRYLGKLVWPTKLAIVYPHPAHGYALNEAWPLWQILAGAAVLLLLTVLCLARLRRQPYLAVGWFWFLGTLVPVIGLVQVGEQSMANRYTYIPLIGPVIALVWAVWDAAAALSTRRGPRPALILPWALSSLLAGLVWGTHRQVLHWRDTLSLFSYAIAVTPDNPSAHFALGVALEKAGQVSQAMVQYRVALAIDPSYAKADYNLGQLFSKAGDLPSAVVHFRAASRSNPNDLASRLNLANSLQHLGRAKDAVPVYEDCIRRDPDSIEALNNLAWILATDPDPQLRNGPRAVRLAERAVALSHSTLPLMIGTLAAAYAEAGRFADAVAAGEKAVTAAAEQAQPEVVQRNRELIELYRAGKPYHEPRR